MEKKKVITINGNNFSEIEGFYDEAYSVLTSGLTWEVAHNLDALNDILYGGFGAFNADEEIILIWNNFEKSRKDLGREPSIAYYERRAADLTGSRAAYFQNLADELKAGRGETLIDTITSIIQDKERIEFIIR